MQSGEFAQAWLISDAVLARRDRAERDDPTKPYHLRWVWDGTPPDGKRVLVRCYHGLGDTLQFLRFLPALRARAAHVTLEAPPELCPLIASFPGIDRLHPFDHAAPLPPSACDIEIMELAHLLRVEPDTLAPAAGTLRIPDHLVAAARPLAAGRIGLCWQAGGWDTSRSIPLGLLLSALPRRPGETFLSLQRGEAAAQATPRHFVNPYDSNMDVLNTAALICAAAHVVTVDTMVAHLAGALGRPFTLLLKSSPDWRWPASGFRSPWYPTATILRQQVAGDWTDLHGEKKGRMFFFEKKNQKTFINGTRLPG